MNKPIVRVFGLVLVLFALLLAFTSRWTVFEASSLRSNKLNKRAFIERQRIRRGTILANNGAVLAYDVPAPGSTRAEPTYERRYPFGPLFAQAIGYSFAEPEQTGLERYRNEALEGHNDEGELQSILNRLQAKQPGGDHVITTLSPHAQQVAMEALRGYSGAIVALEPGTGAVKVMASRPSFDPNQLRTRSGVERIQRTPNGPLVNRAVQAGYAPGSTFKVVTATAAIDSGRFTPTSTVSGRNDVLISGVPLANDQNESYGEITLKEALAKSVNTVWAQVAEKLGRGTMERYMERFGFNRKPKLDYPTEEMEASGSYLHGRLLRVANPYVDLGRMGMGQDKLQVTALQMAEVAAAVGNRGRLMVPHLTDRIVDSEGRIVKQIAPRVQSVVMKPSTAAAVTGMMEAVVNEGTGVPAQIPGVQVAGKTGTAETQFGTATNNVWFIAFAPAAAPRVAVAVTIKKVPGYGATYAAPVARRVMEALLHE
jgi:peptidoglycan glycosyltransferase